MNRVGQCPQSWDTQDGLKVFGDSFAEEGRDVTGERQADRVRSVDMSMRRAVCYYRFLAN